MCPFMAFSTKAWDYLPSFFLAEQFPFRVYSLIGFALFVFAVVLAKRKDNASARMVELALASSILLAFAQAPVSALKDRDGVGGVVMKGKGRLVECGASFEKSSPIELAKFCVRAEIAILCTAANKAFARVVIQILVAIAALID